MPRKIEDYVGKVFGRLTVVSFSHMHEAGLHGDGYVRRMPYWNCVCECGNTHKASRQCLKSEMTRSCGCLNRDRSTTHGMERTKIYSVWAAMKQRCQNAKHRAFKHYGARGITVCERWQKFENFYSDMGESPAPGLSLDRIDNDSGYRPDNCRWATAKEQNTNRRAKQGAGQTTS